jgi:DNA polymerase-3 subunit gamma/tau
MRDAMSALDQVIAFSGNQVRDEDVATLLGLVEPKVLSQTVRAIAKSDLAAILKLVADLVEAGQDLNNFVRRLSGQFRNLMILKAGIADPALLGIPESLLPDLREQAGLFSKEDLLRLFNTFQKIETGMKYATQVRFQLEMGLIELAHIAKLRSLEELIAEFSSVTERPEKDIEQKGRPDSPKSSAAPHLERPALVALQPQHATASIPGKATTPETRKANLSESPAVQSGELPSIRDPREFLFEIASAVGRESLESLLLTLEGARIDGEKVVLEAGACSEFCRKQIKENLPAIGQAAARITGRKITVMLSESISTAPSRSSNSRPDEGTPPEGDLLEKAKREPIIKSFLDVFPGPVKAEKIDP